MALLELGFILVVVGYGAFRLIRSQASARRYLEDGAQEAPLALDHLSSGLRRLATETRTLRISLEGPIRGLQELLSSELTRRDDELMDHTLLEMSRQVNDWLAMVDRLGEGERQRLEEVGGSPEPVRAMLRAEKGAFERSRFYVDGAPSLDVRLQALSQEFARIETALQVQSRIYR